eukprot:CAMPEP_0175816932 /NCGR_PEP_ID=MMETSP0107_2-20121207/6750_1 /TAXON_ID=195067 ORGANISM="Goniomonas pacifica, Strain CCMP1869" /NCGR_SAMPLE_ID=MMETSP0107_2 /ASSEMBLY_ACC=CAM_ASM_000203 /LENGTH=125 /DNA_ID=CAMNT_0017129047 /DNA_START=37 /DNA_END=414 /DNA_ORIENTATION=-
MPTLELHVGPRRKVHARALVLSLELQCGDARGSVTDGDDGSQVDFSPKPWRRFQVRGGGSGPGRVACNHRHPKAPLNKSADKFVSLRLQSSGHAPQKVKELEDNAVGSGCPLESRVVQVPNHVTM